MNRWLHTVIGAAVRHLAVLFGLLWVAGPAQAQAPAEPATQADWVMSYALVVLSIGLGVFVVCMPGKRGQTIRRPRA
jgi:hypothetical protein